MKKIIFLLILAISGSCSNKDDSDQEKLLSGEWYLSEVNCFCNFESITDLEEHTLRFETNKNILHLYNPPESPAYIAESGSYEYIIDEDIILINGTEAFRYEMNRTSLLLTYVDEPTIADDELVLRYNRE